MQETTFFVQMIFLENFESRWMTQKLLETLKILLQIRISRTRFSLKRTFSVIKYHCLYVKLDLSENTLFFV